MPIYSADPFPTDALEANRSGQLTKQQRDRLRPLARYARQSALVGAVVLVVASLMVLTDRQLPLPTVLRVPLRASALFSRPSFSCARSLAATRSLAISVT